MQEMQEMQVRSLSWEDPLEERMAIHSSILDSPLVKEAAEPLFTVLLVRIKQDAVEKSCKKLYTYTEEFNLLPL